MYKYILAGGKLDKSVSLGAVKPLDCTSFSHRPTPFTWCLLKSPLLRGCSAAIQRNPCRRRLNVAGKQGLRPCSQLLHKGKGPSDCLADTYTCERANPWSPCRA